MNNNDRFFHWSTSICNLHYFVEIPNSAFPHHIQHRKSENVCSCSSQLASSLLVKNQSLTTVHEELRHHKIWRKNKQYFDTKKKMRTHRLLFTAFCYETHSNKKHRILCTKHIHKIDISFFYFPFGRRKQEGLAIEAKKCHAHAHTTKRHMRLLVYPPSSYFVSYVRADRWWST